MTEAEWLACADPVAIAAAVWQTASDRHVRLIACGCCRRVWDWLVDARSRRAVEVGERFADGAATDEELGRAAWSAEAAAFAIDAKWERYRREQKGIRAGWLSPLDATEADGIVVGDGSAIPFDDARSAADWAEGCASSRGSVFRRLTSPVFSPAVVRDVVGNPFGPVLADPPWLTSEVLALARGIYAGRAFDRLPVLADALEHAGCDNTTLLDHCRGPGPHVLGCWAVDLVLARA